MNNIISSIGIDVSLLKMIDVVTQYDMVYIPDNSLFIENDIRYYTSEFKNLIHNIKIACSGSQRNYYEKIYLTRSHLPGHKDTGESSIEKEFLEKGYEIIAPETLSFQEQVAMISSCKSLVCTEGSVAHNAIFCKEGTELILLRKADYVNGYQVMINDMNNLEVTYIDAHHTFYSKVPWAGPFYLYRTDSLLAYLGKPTTFLNSRWLDKNWYEYIYVFIHSKHYPRRIANKIKRVLRKWKEK